MQAPHTLESYKKSRLTSVKDIGSRADIQGPAEAPGHLVIIHINIRLRGPPQKKPDILPHTKHSQVYGDPLEHPQRETYWGNVNPIGERSCYDEGKRAAETLTFDYHREHSLDVRLFFWRRCWFKCV